MHFLSSGRDDRVHRWIADQDPHLQLSPGESSATQLQDPLENVHRKEHDALVDMDWEFEELERQVALTVAVNSIEGGFDMESVERVSQLTTRSRETQVEVDETEMNFELPRRTLDRRRDGCFISQVRPSSQIATTQLSYNLFKPFVLPSFESGGATLLPPPSLQRSRTAPPPIKTDCSYRGSTAPSSPPPMAFILQDSGSPLPSAIHFSPTPLDLDAFPTTPCSFGSFALDFRNSVEHDKPLSEQPVPPKLQNVYPTPTQTLLTPSPLTPYSPHSVTSHSSISTPSLSAFPATPSPSPPYHRRRAPKDMYGDDIPPVPALPPSHFARAYPGSFSRSLAIDQAHPTLVTSEPPYTPQLRKRSSTLPSSVPLPGASKRGNELALDTGEQVSSLMDTSSSRFSLSSDGLGDGVVHNHRPRTLLRARAYPSAGIQFATPPRANSRLDSLPPSMSRTETAPHANTRSETLSRANSRSDNLARANSCKKPLSRANSRGETLSRANSGGEHRSPSNTGPKALSRANSRPETRSPANPCVETRHRARSRSETLSRVNLRTDSLSRASSCADTVSRAKRADTLFRVHSRKKHADLRAGISDADSHIGTHSCTGSTPKFYPHVYTGQDSQVPETTTGTPASPTSPMRSLIKNMTRIGLGIKRSIKQGPQLKPSLTIDMQCLPSTPPMIMVDGAENGVLKEEELGTLDTSQSLTKPQIKPLSVASIPLPPTPATLTRSGFPKTPITSSPPVSTPLSPGRGAN